MKGIHHRDPGAALCLLQDTRVTAELILDGVHLAPEIVQFIVQYKGLQHLVLVTDAMRAKCLKAGTYDLGGQEVIVDTGGIARLAKNGKLAGSTLQLHRALKNMQQFTQLSLDKILPLVTTKPLELLGFAAHDPLSAGRRANLLILTKDFNIRAVMYRGQFIPPLFEKMGIYQT
jgi:N-acetylglucosamine-6-phosphate deacetylase